MSLVAVLDADNEGFLRSDRSLIQTAGRAARNVDGMVILYANRITESMRRAMDETERRRQLQLAHNTEHDITPQTVRKEITDILAEYKRDVEVAPLDVMMETQELLELRKSGINPDEQIRAFEKAMKEAAAQLEFEKAAKLRDQIKRLREQQLMVG